jgi:hypothetical protein
MIAATNIAAEKKILGLKWSDRKPLKNLPIDDRFLDDREPKATGIDEAVAERNGQHHADAVPAKFCVDIGGGGLCQGHCLSLCGVRAACQIAGAQANLTIIRNRRHGVSTRWDSAR